MTNFFASCELLCEECGEVSVINFKPIFPGKNCQEILPPKNPPHNSLSKYSNFITLEWERFCPRKYKPREGGRKRKSKSKELLESPKSEKSPRPWALRDRNFQSRLKISRSRPPNPYFSWGILKVRIEDFNRDLKFRATLKFSIEIEFFQSLGL